MSIIIRDISYHYDNQSPLFEHVSLSVGVGEKASLVGNNGTGKSTLLKLIGGELSPRAGSIGYTAPPYYIPQAIRSGNQRIGDLLGVSAKLTAMEAIFRGESAPEHYEILADDWQIETRIRAALQYWGLQHLELTHKADMLSGGERTKLLLAGLQIQDPQVILMDEPTNHLDARSRDRLYDYIRTCKATILAVSHDVTLLDMLDTTYELTNKGIRLYGGNYTFYREQKNTEQQALEQRIDFEQAAVKQARRKAQEVRERQEKRLGQGDRHKDQLPRILRKGAKDRGEATAARLGSKHTEIITQNQERLGELRARQSSKCVLKIDFDDMRLHTGKLLVATIGVNYQYPGADPLWESPVDLEIRSGERIQLTGDNGSGKTTLLRLLTQELQPTEGEVRRAAFTSVCMDQQYSMTDTPKSVLELAEAYNCDNLQDHEIKMRLNRALFPQQMWDCGCRSLSGGEKMRLSLCCLMISNHVPDLFILDEPTNNLDLQSLEILTETLENYRGTLLVISHDREFIRRIGITGIVEVTATQR